MTSESKYILPIMPISWLIFGVLVILSYLISKSVDICFDHYLINHSKNKNHDMIKEPFSGKLQQIIKRKKKKTESTIIIKNESDDENKMYKKLELYGIRVIEEKEVNPKYSNSKFKQNEKYTNSTLSAKTDNNYQNNNNNYNKIIDSVTEIKNIQKNSKSCDDILINRNKPKRILTSKGSYDNIIGKNFESNMKQNSNLNKIIRKRDISKDTSNISKSVNNFYDTFSIIRNNNIETSLIAKSQNRFNNSNKIRKNMKQKMTISNENLLDQSLTKKNSSHNYGLLRIVVSHSSTIGNSIGSYV
jgi:hypothetical protein